VFAVEFPSKKKKKKKKKKGEEKREINQTKLELSSCRFEYKRDFESKNEKKRTCK